MPVAIVIAAVELAQAAIETLPSWAPGLIASVGLSLVSNLFFGPKIPKAEDGNYPVHQTIPPRQAGYGKARIAGFYMLDDLA